MKPRLFITPGPQEKKSILSLSLGCIYLQAKSNRGLREKFIHSSKKESFLALRAAPPQHLSSAAFSALIVLRLVNRASQISQPFPSATKGRSEMRKKRGLNY
jgi:hypothetical protein